jgi:hypothetical protein
MKMTWAGAVVGYGNRVGDVLKNDEAIAAAQKLFVTA